MPLAAFVLKSSAMIEVSSSRRCALELLRSVLGRKRPLDEALADAAQAGLGRLEPRDRAFARLLVATVLRRLGQIDRLLDERLERPLPPRAGPIRDILRLGTAQLLFLGTPPHAAIDTAVSLCGRRSRFRGLINAVLRGIAREGPALIAGEDAARLNTPDWLWRSWSGCYGEDTARAIAETHLGEAPLDITVKGEPGNWARRLEATVLPTASLRRAPGGRPEALPGFRDGVWWVQDAAAAIPARLLGPVAGKRVLELCAAPGGKTAQLALAGARVIALDRSERRMGRLKANLARLGLGAECVVADATRWRPPAPAQAVLLDAPCTATGTIRRHPDIARLKTAKDVSRLAKLQTRLLAAAWQGLAVGGVMVYAACSLEPEECERQIEVLLKGGAPLSRLPILTSEVGSRGELITAQGDLRTLPCHWPELGGLDGFYAARLQRMA